MCGLQNCPREYLSVKALQHHIRKKHKCQVQESDLIPDSDPDTCGTVPIFSSSAATAFQVTVDENITNFTDTVNNWPYFL